MKKTALIISLIAIAFTLNAQISGTPAVPPAPQNSPVATRSEKSAASTPQNIPVQANPVPPVYPGAEPVPVVLPRENVYPAAPVSPTQPGQREPLTPIESTNQLQPVRPPRDQESRDNIINSRPPSLIPDNRVNKNELRAATTVEPTDPLRNSTLVYPAKNDSTRMRQSPRKTSPKKTVVRRKKN